MTEKDKSMMKDGVIAGWKKWNCFFLNRFEGQRQSIDAYGRQQGQDSQVKHEFKSLSINPAEKKPAAAKPADDDDDVDLFGDDDEEQSEQTKQRLAAYAEKKSKSNEQHDSHREFPLSLEPTIIAKSTIVLDVSRCQSKRSRETMDLVR